MALCGAVEAGGTKFICAYGTGPDHLVTTRIPTTTPAETLPLVLRWFRTHAGSELTSLGIGCFGPLNAQGTITNTPKVAWRDFDITSAFRNALGIPVATTTDVKAALRGEQLWGAARNCATALYLTIGTGIGGAAGPWDSEMGHIRVPHDGTFAGICPYHGDCLEGLASGPALQARWGLPGSELPPDHPAWATEAGLIAHALANYTLTLGTTRIILGGGVMRHQPLYASIRAELRRLLAGYAAEPEVLAPGLGERSGILGALSLCPGFSDLISEPTGSSSV